MALQKLAAKVASHYHWVARDIHIGALCDLLDRAGVTPERYTSDTLARELNRVLTERNITTASPSQQKRPLGYFAWMLSLLDAQNVAETDQERLQRVHDEAIERTRRQAAEREATRARMATVDQAEVDRIIAAMNAEADAALRAKRYARPGRV